VLKEMSKPIKNAMEGAEGEKEREKKSGIVGEMRIAKKKRWVRRPLRE